jgi:hypothetical protein
MLRTRATRVRSRLEAGILGGVAAAITFTITSLIPLVTHMGMGMGVIVLGMLGGFTVTWACWQVWRRLVR